MIVQHYQLFCVDSYIQAIKNVLHFFSLVTAKKVLAICWFFKNFVNFLILKIIFPIKKHPFSKHHYKF